MRDPHSQYFTFIYSSLSTQHWLPTIEITAWVYSSVVTKLVMRLYLFLSSVRLPGEDVSSTLRVISGA